MATKAQEPQVPKILPECDLNFPSPQCFFSISTAKNKEKSENVKENQTDENEEHGACNVVSSKSGINKKNPKKERRNKSGLPN